MSLGVGDSSSSTALYHGALYHPAIPGYQGFSVASLVPVRRADSSLRLGWGRKWQESQAFASYFLILSFKSTSEGLG